ncbi:hypothetical protein BGZ94_009330 [Podila epigama]|nr:hypothetical protein BGZ94_009330 [Podila epigama]
MLLQSISTSPSPQWMRVAFLSVSFVSCVTATLSSPHILSIPSPRPAVSSPPFTDIAHLLDSPSSQLFSLDLKELSTAYHHRKPHLLTEPDTNDDTIQSSNTPLFRGEEIVANKGQGSNAFTEQDSLPTIPVSLTGIPKDYGYTARFSIGTYPSSRNGAVSHGSIFNLLIDTGSDLTVVTSAACTAPECLRVPHRFDCTASLTCKSTRNLLDGKERWVQGYGDGTQANGTLIHETLRFISDDDHDNDGIRDVGPPKTMIELTRQPLLVVDAPGLNLFKSYGSSVDGIVGLNLGSPVAVPTVLQNLQMLEVTMGAASKVANRYSQQQQEQPKDTRSRGMGLMSLVLSKSLEPGMGGELLLNGIDPSRFRGSIYWSERGPSPFDWAIQLDQDGIILHTPSLSLTNTPTRESVPYTAHAYAVLDSGSDGIYLQRSTYDQLFSRVPGALQLPTGYWRVPCEGNTDLVFSIQGRRYHVRYHDWVKPPNPSTAPMCQAKVYGSSPGPILLGATFLRTVYTIFDFSHPGWERVGFAELR